MQVMDWYRKTVKLVSNCGKVVSIVVVLVNKSEGVEPELAESEFQELGLGEPVAISAKRGDGVQDLVETVLGNYEDAV